MTSFSNVLNIPGLMPVDLHSSNPYPFFAPQIRPSQSVPQFAPPATQAPQQPISGAGGAPAQTSSGGGSGDQFASLPSYGGGYGSIPQGGGSGYQIHAPNLGDYQPSASDFSSMSQMPLLPVGGQDQQQQAYSQLGLPPIPSQATSDGGASNWDNAHAVLNGMGLLGGPIGSISSLVNMGIGADQGYNNQIYGNQNTQYDIGDGSGSVNAPGPSQNPTLAGSQFLGNMAYGTGLAGTIGNLLGNAAGWVGQNIFGANNSPIDANPNISAAPAGASPLNGSMVDPTAGIGMQQALDSFRSGSFIPSGLGGDGGYVSSFPNSASFGSAGNLLDSFMQGAGFGGAGYGYGDANQNGAFNAGNAYDPLNNMGGKSKLDTN